MKTNSASSVKSRLRGSHTTIIREDLIKSNIDKYLKTKCQKASAGLKKGNSIEDRASRAVNRIVRASILYKSRVFCDRMRKKSQEIGKTSNEETEFEENKLAAQQLGLSKRLLTSSGISQNPENNKNKFFRYGKASKLDFKDFKVVRPRQATQKIDFEKMNKITVSKVRKSKPKVDLKQIQQSKENHFFHQSSRVEQSTFSLLRFRSTSTAMNLIENMRLPKNFCDPLNKRHHGLHKEAFVNDWHLLPKTFEKILPYAHAKFNKIQREKLRKLKSVRSKYRSLYNQHLERIQDQADRIFKGFEKYVK